MRALVHVASMICLGLVCPHLSAATIVGIVTSAETGLPVGGAFISISIPLVAGSASTYSAEDGSYSMEFNETGGAFLRASADGYLGFTQLTSVPGAGQTLTANIMLEPERFITGRLFDAQSGLPLVGRGIRAYTPIGEVAADQQTDHSGRFVFGSLRNQVYAVCIINADDEYLNQCWDGRHAQFLAPLGEFEFTPIQSSLDSGPDQILMFMHRGAKLRGRLVDRLSGESITNSSTRVTLYNGEGRPMSGVAAPVTNAEGEFHIEGLLELPYFLSVSVDTPYYTHSVHPGVDCMGFNCQPLEGAVVVPTAAQTTVLQRHTLYPGATVTGRVTAAETGDALNGIVVNLYQASFIFWLLTDQTVSAADGSYLFDHRPSGQYRIATDTRSTRINQVVPGGDCYGSCGGSSVGGSLLLGTNETLEIDDIALGLGVAVRGQAHQPGFSGGGHRVTLFDDQGTIMQTKTADERGRFHFDAWLPGTYYAQSSDLSQYCERYMGFACTTAPVTDATPIILPNVGDIAEINFNLPVEIIQLDGFE